MIPYIAAIYEKDDLGFSQRVVLGTEYETCVPRRLKLNPPLWFRGV